MILLLTRHAQTVWHRENRYAGGHSDIDLTPAGIRQAERLAAWTRARDVDAVVSSPVRRAVETAQPCAAAAGVPLRIVDDLREVGFGVAEGRMLAELDDDVVARFRAGRPFPGAESFDDAAQRAAAALRALAHPPDNGDRTVLVVAHSTLLRLGLCVLLDMPVHRYRQVFPRLDNTAITVIDVPDDPTRPAALLSLNVPCTPILCSKESR